MAVYLSKMAATMVGSMVFPGGHSDRKSPLLGSLKMTSNVHDVARKIVIRFFRI